MNPADTAAPRLIDGPADALGTVVLAHGAGAPMDSPFMAAIACGLAQHGWRVLRFEFAYMARQRILERRQGPDRMPVLQQGPEFTGHHLGEPVAAGAVLQALGGVT